MNKQTRPINITPDALRGLPLPLPDERGDKEARGRVLLVGGGRETTGAVILAGEAALRAGAGKLQVATVAYSAPQVSASIPEARVLALPETKAGGFAKSASAKLEKHLGEAQCVCIGPGMLDGASVLRFVNETLRCCRGVPVVLDAGALACLDKREQTLQTLKGRAIVTPNAEELADIFGETKEEIQASPLEAARRAAHLFRAVVALKGRETFIASPEGEVYVNRRGSVGLATSGSGDVLAGVVAGLMARGCEPLSAAVWGVYLHACAGERVAERTGPLGFLARELPLEIPKLMSKLTNQ